MPLPQNLAFDKDPREPIFLMPSGAVNTHCHVNSEGTAEFPYSPDRKYDPYPASWAQLDELDTYLGFSQTVIVASTGHGTDNRFLVDALKKSNGCARGVAFVESDITNEELLALHEAGVRGVRYSYVKRLVNPGPPEVMTEMAKRLKALGLDWHIDLYVESEDLLDEKLVSHIKNMPLPIAFDHMAIPDLKEGIDGPKFKLFKEIIAKRNDFMIKLTCPERITGSGDPKDWERALPYAQALFDLFPNQVITGTDWPHPNMKEGQMPNDGDLVNRWILNIARGDQAKLEQILVHNPRRLFDFPLPGAQPELADKARLVRGAPASRIGAPKA